MVDGSEWCGRGVALVLLGTSWFAHSWAGLAGPGWVWLWGWTYEAWCWIVVFGMPTQWRSQTVVQDGGMSEVYLAAFLTECVCVCEWLRVCVPRGSASPAFGGLHRWVRTHHAETLERQTWRKIWPTLPKEGREAPPLSQLTMRRFKQFTSKSTTQHLWFCLKGILFMKKMQHARVATCLG